ncbi:MAG TPA: porphobilinogen synthase [Solirubrobacteraceae bacterium]|nr:porphobilinogen synthase [Solirubrobacteraceae bacterium]
MAFPQTRMRRLRASAGLRGLVRETDLRAGQLVLPLFVTEVEPSGARRAGHEPIATMPGVDRLSLSAVVEEAHEAAALGIAGVMLFGLPADKDEHGSGAWDDDGVVQLATRAIKQGRPELLVLTDVCLCEYTSHGHCGVLDHDTSPPSVDNDASLELLARTAVSHARAGADIVAPSDMMDGRVGAIREALDGEGFSEVPLLAYSAKFASAFYGPFREAADSAPAFGDRRGYQMDPANGREAVREALLDVQEGADMVMVKPALAYGDLIRAVKRATRLPVAAYNVSGEYAMVKAAAAAGYLDERATVLEILTSLRRAGADTIITYHAKDAATWLAEQT